MIPNQRLLALAGTTLSMIDAFKKADEVLLNAVQGISDLINNTGLINSDFADVKTIMQNKGMALMGIGYGEGEHRAVEAATNAISSPLLEDVSIDGATGIIINVTGGSNLKIHEINEATTLIMEAAHEDAEIIFGTVIDETMKDAVKVTVIATGLNSAEAAAGINAGGSASAAERSDALAVRPSSGGCTGRGSGWSGSDGILRRNSGLPREDGGAGARRSRRFRRASERSDRFEFLGHGDGSSGSGR